MRRVLDESIWIHGTYRFVCRESMYATIAAAKELLVDDGARTPLEVSCNVVGESTLLVMVKVPMFEEHEYAASLFGMFRSAARSSNVEARVDVM